MLGAIHLPLLKGGFCEVNELATWFNTDCCNLLYAEQFFCGYNECGKNELDVQQDVSWIGALPNLSGDVAAANNLDCARTLHHMRKVSDPIS